MAMSSHQLFFSSGVDQLSETQVLDALHLLNYSIDNLIVNIIAADRLLPSHRNHKLPTDSACDAALLAFLRNSRLSDGDARSFVVENHLRNLVLILIHIHFFDGRFFFGVGSDTIREYLDRMITILIEDGKLLLFIFIFIFSDHLLSDNFENFVIQRWRTMAVEAIFKMNDGIESLFNAQLVPSIAKLENALTTAFPDSMLTRNIYFIGHDEHLLLLDIVKQARDLSFKLQHGFVSCRLIVTVAPGSKPTYDGIGTYAFGLDRLSGTRTVLLEAKAITVDRVQS